MVSAEFFSLIVRIITDFRMILLCTLHIFTLIKRTE